MAQRRSSRLPEFHEARNAFLDLSDALLQEEQLSARMWDQPSVEQARAWWDAVARVHSCLRSAGLGFQRANSPPNFSAGALDQFCLRQQIVAEALATGNGNHNFIGAVVHPGRRPQEFLLGADIDWAYLYMAMAQDGLIEDPTYNRTVCRAFGVERTTVQKWARYHQPTHALLGYPKDFTPESVTRHMIAAGKSYQDVLRNGE